MAYGNGRRIPEQKAIALDFLVRVFILASWPLDKSTASCLGAKGDLPDAAYFAMIKGGSDVKPALGRGGVKDGGMQAFGADLSDDDIWAIVAWLRNQKAHEATEPPRKEAAEHR